MSPPIGGVRAGYLSAGKDALPDSGISRWTFDDADTESGTAVDVWGNNDGTINGATTGVSGANQTYTTNEAYDFDGSDDLVTVGTAIGDGLSSGDADFTVAAWVNIDSDSQPSVIYGTDSSQNVRWMLQTDGGGGGYFEFFVADGSGTIQAVGPTTFSLDTWYHVCGVRRSGSFYLYLDGSQEAQVSDSLGSLFNGYDESVGASSQGKNYFDGSIDDPRAYSKGLTDTEISNLYNTGSISG